VTELAVSCSEVLAVAAQDDDRVHLRTGTTVATLCGTPAAGPRSVVAYFVAGCLPCARLAVEAEMPTATDHRHAAIDLARFLGSRRS